MESAKPLHVLLTGASGYVGRRMVQAAVDRGYQVTALGRTIVAGTRHVPWALGETPPDEAFAGVDVIIHLAHHWESAENGGEVNRDGATLLLAAARRHAVRRFLFASSLSSRADAPNRYGRAKWAIEQDLKAPDELAVRIGLVYGGSERSIWGLLCHLVKHWPLLPMIDPWREVQPVHVDDVCDGLLRLARLETPSSPVYILGDDTAVPFGRFLKLMGEETFGKRRLIVPVPSALVLPVIGLLERLPLSVPIDRERVYGLAGARALPSAAGLSEIGLDLRPVADGLAAERADRRRRLLEEGRVLMVPLLGGEPTSAALRLYVKAVEATADRRPLAVPALLRWWPLLARASEPIGSRAGARRARARFHLAATVIDATPEGAAQIYDYRGASRLASLARLLILAITEATLVPVRLVMAKLVWR